MLLALRRVDVLCIATSVDNLDVLLMLHVFVCLAWYFVCFVSTLVLMYISQLSLRRWPDHHHHHHHNDNESSSADDADAHYTGARQQQTTTGNCHYTTGNYTYERTPQRTSRLYACARQ